MSNDLYQAVGARIREIRERRGWTQQHLGQLLGPGHSRATIDAAVIDDIESGDVHLSLHRLQTLANILGVPLPELLQPELLQIEPASPIEWMALCLPARRLCQQIGQLDRWLAAVADAEHVEVRLQLDRGRSVASPELRVH